MDAALAATRLLGARGVHPEIGAVQLVNDALMTLSPSGTSEVNRKRIAEIALGRYHAVVPPWDEQQEREGIMG